MKRPLGAGVALVGVVAVLSTTGGFTTAAEPSEPTPAEVCPVGVQADAVRADVVPVLTAAGFTLVAGSADMQVMSVTEQIRTYTTSPTRAVWSLSGRVDLNGGYADVLVVSADSSASDSECVSQYRQMLDDDDVAHIPASGVADGPVEGFVMDSALRSFRTSHWVTGFAAADLIG